MMNIGKNSREDERGQIRGQLGKLWRVMERTARKKKKKKRRRRRWRMIDERIAGKMKSGRGEDSWEKDRWENSKEDDRGEEDS